MATVYDYDMSMLMIADTIIDTLRPSSDKDKLQDEPGTTGLPTVPTVQDDDDEDDLDLDPIPIDSMKDREGDLALVSFAASLDYCLLSENEENLPMYPNSDDHTITTSNKCPIPNHHLTNKASQVQTQDEKSEPRGKPSPKSRIPIVTPWNTAKTMSYSGAEVMLVTIQETCTFCERSE